MKKLKNIVYNLYPILPLIICFFVWVFISEKEIIPRFILPTPKEVFYAFLQDFHIIKEHLIFTLTEAILGLIISILGAFFIAILMDKYKIIYKSFYPILVITQTIPTICLAPLIILWFGFGILPKILLIYITCSFPLLISILNGFNSVDKEIINLLKSMNASYIQTLLFAKIPLSLRSFFSGLKIATSYSIIGAIISEWLGGDKGLGVYMTRVRKSFNFDKMFVVIIIISLLSIIFVEIIKLIEKRIIKWEK